MARGGILHGCPLRTLRNEITGEYKANPDFVWDTITYQYSSVFYLPEESRYNFQEAVIQLDRIVTLHQSWLLDPRSAKLSDDARVCLSAWLQNYIFGKLPKKFNENLEAYKAMVGEDPDKSRFIWKNWNLIIIKALIIQKPFDTILTFIKIQ